MDLASTFYYTTYDMEPLHALFARNMTLVVHVAPYFVSI